MKKILSGTGGLVVRLIVAAFAITCVFLLFAPSVGGALGSWSFDGALSGFQATFGEPHVAKFNVGMFIMFLLLVFSVIATGANVVLKKPILDYVSVAMLAIGGFLSFLTVILYKGANGISMDSSIVEMRVGPLLIGIFAFIAAFGALLLALYPSTGKKSKKRR